MLDISDTKHMQYMQYDCNQKVFVCGGRLEHKYQEGICFVTPACLSCLVYSPWFSYLA